MLSCSSVVNHQFSHFSFAKRSQFLYEFFLNGTQFRQAKHSATRFVSVPITSMEYVKHGWNILTGFFTEYVCTYASHYQSFLLILWKWNVNVKTLSDWRNLITYCYIHNDSTVELSKCGTMIASFEVASSKKIISKYKSTSKRVIFISLMRSCFWSLFQLYIV